MSFTESMNLIWVDLKRVEGERSLDFAFTTSSETADPYLGWAGGQPNSYDDNCVELTSNGADMGYNDSPCLFPNPRICETDSELAQTNIYLHPSLPLTTSPVRISRSCDKICVRVLKKIFDIFCWNNAKRTRSRQRNVDINVYSSRKWLLLGAGA